MRALERRAKRGLGIEAKVQKGRLAPAVAAGGVD
jgi:polar amino acid transport system permease protein